jgi:hypothetical protein
LLGAPESKIFKSIRSLVERFIPTGRELWIAITPVVCRPPADTGGTCRSSNASAAAQGFEKLCLCLWCSPPVSA